MKRIAFLLIAVAAVAGFVAFTAPASRRADGEAAVPRRHNDCPASLEIRPVGRKQQSLRPSPVFRCRPPINIQFMVKDSTKWAATGGWGFAQFDKDGKPNLPEAALKTCFPCHGPGKAGDFVFTHFAP